MNITDNGPNPNAFDLETATKENGDYRTVAWSGVYLQVTLMSIPPGQSIGLEAHPETDQFIRLDAGSGRATLGPSKDNLNFQADVSDGGIASGRRSRPSVGAVLASHGFACR